MNKLKLLIRILIFGVAGGFSIFSWSAPVTEFWTAKIKGVQTSVAGAVAVFVPDSPVSPNPKEASWQGCDGNFIYFHQDANGKAINADAINRMLSVATAAWVAEKSVRLGITRDSRGKCYTAQIFPSR